MKNLAFLFLFIFSCNAYGQVHEPAMLSLRGIGGNGVDQVLRNVTQTNDGGLIVCINSNSTAGLGNIDSFCGNLSGNRNIFLKYNSDASILEWSRCYQWDGDTQFSYIFPQNDGGTVFGGNYTSAGGWGFYICKQDASGTILWSHGYSKGNNLFFESMIATEDGGYILTGESSYADTNVSIHYGSFTDADIFVLKVDSMGNKVWGRVLGGTLDESVYSIVAAPNDGCYVIAETSSNDHDCSGSHGAMDAYVARLDKDGNILWHKDMGGTGEDGAGYAVPDGRGGIIVAANTSSSDGDVSNNIGAAANFWVLNVDTSGNIIWNNCYGGGYCYARDICKATDGSIWIAGTSSVKGGEVDTAFDLVDAWFVHADGVGNFINAKVLGSYQQDDGSMVYPLSNGNVIAGGYYGKNNGSFTGYGSFGSFPIVDAFLAVLAPGDQTGIKQVPVANNDVKIYPNPATEKVSIEPERAEKYHLGISDVIGETVYKAECIGKTTVNIKNWAKGMYYVQIIDENGVKSIQKLVVQ